VAGTLPPLCIACDVSTRSTLQAVQEGATSSRALLEQLVSRQEEVAREVGELRGLLQSLLASRDTVMWM
jgi:hypothetical protein